mmetsp:Transcript_12831/g.22226  ORF Transcript_12831/g.22226 Transcript_12831/m.22226 type:complete len:222 (+) Transcript_12831:480-1145(+)
MHQLPVQQSLPIIPCDLRPNNFHLHGEEAPHLGGQLSEASGHQDEDQLLGGIAFEDRQQRLIHQLPRLLDRPGTAAAFAAGRGSRRRRCAPGATGLPLHVAQQRTAIVVEDALATTVGARCLPIITNIGEFGCGHRTDLVLIAMSGTLETLVIALLRCFGAFAHQATLLRALKSFRSGAIHRAIGLAKGATVVAGTGSTGAAVLGMKLLLQVAAAQALVGL